MKHQNPYFSIIVPTYNRPSQLKKCLESLVHLDYPRDRFEVIVVDDGGKRPLETVVVPFRNEINLSLIKKPNAGPASARNSGAELAKGSILAFTDDDCSPDTKWLRTLGGLFTKTRNCAIGGSTQNLLINNTYSTASQIIIGYLYDYYNHNHKKARFLTSNNLAISKELFMSIGGFDTTYPHAASEDRELCNRMLYHGYQMTYSKEVVVYHAHNLSFVSYLCQHFNYGRGAFRFHRVRDRYGQKRIKLEPMSFYLNLLKYPFSNFSGLRGTLIALLLGISQAFHALGYFYEWFYQTKKKLDNQFHTNIF